MSGSDVTFNVKGQPVAGYIALPSQPDAPGVLVFHAWWGLNPTFKKLCDRLAAEGFAAFAPDLREGHVATTIDEAKRLLGELDEMKNQAVVEAAVAFLKNRSDLHNEDLSVIGFSMGAAWSLVAAEEYPQDISKVVLFYGSYSDLQFSNAKARFLGNFAEMDEWEPAEEVNRMEKNMQAASLKTEFHFYPNTSHWFFEEDRPEFDAEAAQLAWTRTLDFLRA
ncbi:MAG: dienelactone hydrolase family protein [Anaerolineales bacterium]|nr:dienelactone hydrolase family protein [Anaerolineae bacterium]PWB68948.1 MAG: dienelactone hydrolase family protein [Anaerolineales bacterium]